MSREFLAGALREQSSPDPDQANARTIALMCARIHSSAADPLLKEAAQEACGYPAIFGTSGTDANVAECCWWWAKHKIKFVHHDELIQAWLGEADQLQLLISPDVLVRMPAAGYPMQGDCAIFTMAICALLEALGLPWEIVTVAANPRAPGIFSHVYPRAILEDGRRVPLDASHGTYPGWEVPREHCSRIQVWGESGNPASDQGPRFTGLHGYMMGLSAPGDITSSPPSTGGGAGVWDVIGRQLDQWTQIGGRVLAPTTTYQSASGSFSTPGSLPAGTQLPGLYQSPGGAALTGGIGLGTIAILGGLGLLAVFAMTRGKR